MATTPMENMQSPLTPRTSGRGRGPGARPSSRHGAPTTQSNIAARPPPKIFNCIVDDTALVAGVKRSTRNGIRQWVKNGNIRLFVPLYALEQLSRQRNSNNRHGEDVRETLNWLDDATSRYPHAVALQGADETYEKWADVEIFAVPRTLFSENDLGDDFWSEPDTAADMVPVGDLEELVLNDINPRTPSSSAKSNASRSASPASFHSQISANSAVSPPTSPAKPVTSPRTPHPASRRSSQVPKCHTVPVRLRSLFNYILWRIHQELDPVAALESFIFLCNDATKVEHAKGFEIKIKRLEQLREAISREDRDAKNRQTVLTREHRAASATAEITPQDSVEESSLAPNPPSPVKSQIPGVLNPPISFEKKVMDPNAFGRGGPLTVVPSHIDEQHRSPRMKPAFPASPMRGDHAHTSTFRGRGSTRGAPRGRGRGFHRGGFVQDQALSRNNNDRHGAAAPVGQIDPDSFSRSRGGGPAPRGGRKLWTPS